MPQKETQPKNKTRQEGREPSFFKIDSQNWPDISQPAPKPKRPRNPYKLLGIVKFPDPALRPLPTPTIPGLRRIPQSRLKEAETQEGINSQNSEVFPSEKEIYRTQAITLIHKFQAGEIELDGVRNFYYNNSQSLVDNKPFLAYCQYATKHNLKTMPWEKYAKQRAQELFISDLFHLMDLRDQYYKPRKRTKLLEVIGKLLRRYKRK